MAARARLEFSLSDGSGLVLIRPWDDSWHIEGGFSPSDPKMRGVMLAFGGESHPLQVLLGYTGAELEHINVYYLAGD